jgi:hypothetical protein
VRTEHEFTLVRAAMSSGVVYNMAMRLVGVQPKTLQGMVLSEDNEE